MKTKTKRIWLALALVTAFAVAVGLLWKQEPPQIITLPNGERYQFVTAEWGTNQVQPTFAARFVARLPTRLANYIMQKYGSRLGIVTPVAPLGTILGPMFRGSGPVKPPEPSLHFWFRCISSNAAGTPGSGNFKFMLADKDGVIGGKGNGGWASYGQGTNKWLTFALPVLPRRSDTLQLLVFKADDQFHGPYSQIGAVRFRNPLNGHFLNWQPDTLPVTKTAGDLTVRLTDFAVGSGNRGGNDIIEVGGRQTRFHPPAAGEDHEVVFKLDIQSPRGTNEIWLIQPAELSDATGNRVHTEYCSRWGVTDEYHFGPALWPDESAWRLKLTLRRYRSYDPEELVTFTNVPVPVVGATNTVFMTNRIQGVPVVLKQEFVRKPDMAPAEGGAEISATHAVAELVNPPEGFVVDFKEVQAGTGGNLVESGRRQTANAALVILFSIPANATTVDLTWAVQKTRTVEFLVKPPKAE